MHIRKEFISALFFLLLFGLNTSSVLAVTVQINGLPANIQYDEEFSFSVNVEGASANTDNYLRAAFYHDSQPSSYFGFTFNHLNEWYNGSPTPIDPHKFLQIQIDSDKKWSGQLQSKFDISSSFFKGGGNYNFKVGRYTSGGTSVADWSNTVVIEVVAPLPTPTNTPTPTNSPIPTSTPKPTNTPTPTRTPTPTKTPTPIKTPTPTKVPSLTPFKTVVPTPTDIQTIETLDNKDSTSSLSAQTKEILGLETKDSSEEMVVPTDIPISPSPRVKGIFQSVLSPFLILMGVVTLLVGGVLVYFKYNKRSMKYEV